MSKITPKNISIVTDVNSVNENKMTDRFKVGEQVRYTTGTASMTGKFKVGEKVIAVYQSVWTNELVAGQVYTIARYTKDHKIKVEGGHYLWKPEAFRKLTPLEKLL